jgi:ribosomal protein L11 methyltransferase
MARCRADRAGQTVLDVGTGSGILAIASRLLGAKAVFACDIDPIAAVVAGANINRNGQNEISVFCGSLDAVMNASVRLLLANLTADLIMSLFGEIDRVLERRGIAIFSGILREQSEELRALITKHRYNIFEEITQGEWLVLIVEKHVA